MSAQRIIRFEDLVREIGELLHPDRLVGQLTDDRGQQLAPGDVMEHLVVLLPQLVGVVRVAAKTKC